MSRFFSCAGFSPYTLPFLEKCPLSFTYFKINFLFSFKDLPLIAHVCVQVTGVQKRMLVPVERQYSEVGKVHRMLETKLVSSAREYTLRLSASSQAPQPLSWFYLVLL